MILYFMSVANGEVFRDAMMVRVPPHRGEESGVWGITLPRSRLCWALSKYETEGSDPRIALQSQLPSPGPTPFPPAV